MSGPADKWLRRRSTAKQTAARGLLYPSPTTTATTTSPLCFSVLLHNHMHRSISSRGKKKRRDESGRDEKGTPGETAVIRWWWDGVSNLASVYSVNILSAACFFDNFLFLFFFKNAQTISNGADCFERRAGVEGWSRGRGEGRGGGHSSANGSSLTLRSRSTLLNYDTYRGTTSQRDH